MKKLVCALAVSLILMGCSSNGSTGYKPVQVSSSEAAALSALSNLTGIKKDNSESAALSNGASESPLKAAIFKK